ncbi:MAG: 50S ribosomal protein L11 methyltransferase, partial [Gorillibacterium sp.]|nr:50S ribosomal protein L11 methyltransferase [Gorillibacterium sp.]
MRWHEITISTTEEAIEMTANFMHELGAGGVSIEESGTLNKVRDTTYGELYDQPLNDIPEGQAVIKGYFEAGMDPEDLVRSLTTAVLGLKAFDIDPGNPVVEAKEVDDSDWADAWKQYFKPIRITERLTIKPSWEDYTPQAGEIILDLDPGMAFGTGTHATTSLCLKSIEKQIRPGDEIIDVGTGSGVLAIAAVKLGAKSVLALDLDPVAVTVAKENVERNGLSAQINVQLSDLLGVLQQNNDQHTLGITLPVRVVVANILA